MLLVFAVGLGWFPIQGMVSLRAMSTGTGSGFDRVLGVVHHLALPAVPYLKREIHLPAGTSGTRKSLISPADEF